MTELSEDSCSRAEMVARVSFTEQVAEFYGGLHRQLHTSWLPEQVDVDLWIRLAHHPRSENHLAAWLVQTFGLASVDPYDFKEPNHRLALLPARQLQRVLLLTGVALQAEALARCIDRPSVQAARRELGDRVYRFALKKAPFLLGRFPYRCTKQETGTWLDRSLRTAYACLNAAMTDLPRPELARLRLKLPRSFQDWPRQDDWEAAPCGLLLRKILIQEVEPTWVRFDS